MLFRQRFLDGIRDGTVTLAFRPRLASVAGGRRSQRSTANVRKLKALGLTESLEVGYRLSLRGESLLRMALAVEGRTT